MAILCKKFLYLLFHFKTFEIKIKFFIQKNFFNLSGILNNLN
ncbi:hypothetical protein HMPREF1864_00660 [Peptoniphilus sp. DNF00840]|nr:hypothetical protein HMPREF1864_00660 [Peptoniphilus sp. DNF00840]